jgi:hypothetical protein
LKIRIIKIKENSDGSADVDVRYDKAGWEFLIEKGINACFVEAIMTKELGELYGISDILGTLSQKGSKRRSNKGVAKIKSGGTD